MSKPTLEQLDKIRQEGFRPSVVACLLHDKKLLMVYKKEYKLWQIPQGGINNKEDPDDALRKELTEEFGAEFVKQVDFSTTRYLDKDQMEFKPGRHKVVAFADDSGKEINMMGKLYYFVAVDCISDNLDITRTQFDQHFWMSFREAYFLAEKMYQKGKKRVTIKILNTLYNSGLIE